MGDYSAWINWFRKVAPKPPGAAPASRLGAPVYDAERIRRVMARNASTAVQNLSHLRPLSPAERMINWLKTQPAEVVDAAAECLNWDRAGEVILWLLDRSTTQAATAVKLFMRAGPASYVNRKANHPSYEYDEFAEKAIQTFAANWTANRYALGGVGYDPSEVTPYGSSDIFFINEFNELMATFSAKGVNPLPILPGLEGPFKGPKPKELDVYLAQIGRGELFLVRFCLQAWAHGWWMRKSAKRTSTSGCRNAV